jgi:hypothetical protein
MTEMFSTFGAGAILFRTQPTKYIVTLRKNINDLKKVVHAPVLPKRNTFDDH